MLSGAAYAAPLWTPAAQRAWGAQRTAIADPSGTTLERTIVPAGDGPYFRLTYGHPWPIQVRTELAEPKRGRDARRVALASFLHLTDFQLADAQSPARVEFVDRYSDPPTGQIPVNAAQRPEESVVAHAVEAAIQRANAVLDGPITGRRFDFTVCTGDNIDNRHTNELRWFLTLMDGGEIAANSGAPDTFEGVQGFDSPEYYDPHYWHPDPIDDPVDRAPDDYKRFYGYPDYPGLLTAAINPFVASGLLGPWYTCWGNHDALVQGNEQPNPAYEAIATGGTKVLHPPPGWTPGDFYRGLVTGDPEALTAFSVAPSRPVTPDGGRTFITPEDYIRAHLGSPSLPRGHGFTEDNLDPLHLYYAFDVAEGIRGLVLDTTSNRSSEGSIGQAQLDWLEEQLIAVHSRYYDDAGTEQTTRNQDELVVIFSHHPPRAMLPVQGPNERGEVEQRYGGDTVEALLHRFPNVILWVNGHTHTNRVLPSPDPQGRTGGYWDITTAAMCDPPQQARVLEVVDNRDGTLSIFGTILDHAAEPQTDPADLSVLGLASIGRETAFNDHQVDVTSAIGQPTDLNVELLVTAPFELRTTPPNRGPDGDRRKGGTSERDLPTTGTGLGATALGAAVAGAIALRERGTGGRDQAQ